MSVGYLLRHLEAFKQNQPFYFSSLVFLHDEIITIVKHLSQITNSRIQETGGKNKILWVTTRLVQTANDQLIVIKETNGYVCDETRQSIEGSPELFGVMDQQRYGKA